MKAKRIAALAVLAGAAALSASAAQAATPALQNVGGRTPATASTSFGPRLVAGGRGDWARTAAYRLKVTVTGGASVQLALCGPGAPDCYIFQAVATVTGTWRSLPHAFTPRYTGARIAGTVDGTLAGSMTWDFYASGYPYAKLVPGSITGSADLAHWYERFFGPGTRFGGKGLVAQAFTYRADGCDQRWADSAATGNGQDAGAGNIRGGRGCR